MTLKAADRRGSKVNVFYLLRLVSLLNWNGGEVCTVVSFLLVFLVLSPLFSV